jgi:polygalacturonase
MIAERVKFAVVVALMIVGARAAATAKTQATGGASSAVTAYELPAIYKASSTYSLKANGKNIAVVDFSKQYDYAVFTADGACQLEIARVDGKAIKQHSISPMKLNLAGEAAGAKLTFKSDEPRYYIVAIDDLRKLVIAIDPAETDSPFVSGAGVFNVTDAPYSADRSGKSDSTAAMQRAVEDAAKSVVAASANKLTPSPGTPGEGGGEGSRASASNAAGASTASNPHPNPSTSHEYMGTPEFRVRGQEDLATGQKDLASGQGEKARRVGTAHHSEEVGSAHPTRRDAGDAQAIVYVPNGVYRLRELCLRSNVALYLDSGAVLQLSGTREQLKQRYYKKSQNRHGTWFIYTADGATNVKIYGRGTIDGDGQRLEKSADLTSHLVLPMNCDGFTLDGPVVRDSGLWGTVVANSKNVALRNTKHFNRLDMGENDCVDICNSQNVTVERSIGISLDDPYSTKCWQPETDLTKQWTGEFRANKNIVIEDCLSWTRCFAFKIGAGVWRDQEEITIRNCVAYDSAHAFGISHSYGSKDVRNIVVDGLDVERNTMTNLGQSWARIVIDAGKRDGSEGGSVYDVIIKNVNVRDAGIDAVPINGLADDKHIQRVTFENIRMPGKTAVAATLEEVGVKETRFAEELSVKNNVSPREAKKPSEGRPVRESVSGRESETQG